MNPEDNPADSSRCHEHDMMVDEIHRLKGKVDIAMKHLRHSQPCICTGTKTCYRCQTLEALEE